MAKITKPTKVEDLTPKVEDLTIKPEVQELAALKPRLFVCVNNRLWHPHQSVYINSTPVELKYDSWTECQHSAGLIKEI